MVETSALNNRSKMLIALCLQNSTDAFDKEAINTGLFGQKDSVTRTPVDHEEWTKLFTVALGHRGYSGTVDELTAYLDELKANNTFSYRDGIVTMKPGRMYDIYQPLLAELTQSMAE